MKINNLTPERAILQELGDRLARHRKQRGLSQTELANEAGVGEATLRRIEAGEGSQIESWLKILKALQMYSAIDRFLPETVDSPMAQAKAQTSKKQRGTTSGKRWGDEAE